MFSSIRQYDGAGSVEEITRGAERELFPLLRQQDGFISYSVIHVSRGNVASVSMFETRAQAQAANEAVRDMVTKLFKDLLPNPPTVTIGEVTTHLTK